MALAPDFPSSGRFYVNFTNTNGDTVVARFKRSNGTVDPASRFDLKWGPERSPVIPQPFVNHNGGHLAFGPDGYLYIGLGDGGSADDPGRRAQDPSTLLGKMLRIDVVNVPDDHPNGYLVPADNPFLEGTPVAARPEIWSFGWRNPWRYSFDPIALGGTGALVAADVGQNNWEEIDYEPRGAGGRNYGWRNREGAQANPNLAPCGPPPSPPCPAYQPLIDPIHQYSHADGSSISGGYVYRGASLGAAYRGRYFYADYVRQRVWSLGLNIGPGGEASAACDAVSAYTGDRWTATISRVRTASVKIRAKASVAAVTRMRLRSKPRSEKPARSKERRPGRFRRWRIVSQASSVHGLLSLQPGGPPPMHTPAWHRSPTVQALPSSQGPEAGTPPWHWMPAHDSPAVQGFPSSHAPVRAAYAHPPGGAHVSSVQEFPSLQSVGPPPAQAPPEQASFAVQGSPSLHGAVFAALTHPVAGLQESSVQRFPSSHPSGGPGTHAPAEQVSPFVQALPSLQVAELFPWAHPVAGLHESFVQSLPSSQFAGAPPTHAPMRHVSPTVQALPSSHVAVLMMCRQPPITLQTSSVQGFVSAQSGGGPPAQTPPAHPSFVVHALPSLQGLALGRWTHPVAGTQASSVQTLPSSQTGGGPPAHAPPEQTSFAVHAFPSLQGAVLLVWTHPAAGWQLSSVHPLPSLQFGGDPGLQTSLMQTSMPLQALPSPQAALDRQPVVVVYCTVSFGRWLAVVYSEDRTSTSTVESGRKIHPKFSEGEFAQVWTSDVTLREEAPSASGALPTSGPISLACTPASPPKLL
jgi:hypothetical protein